LQPLHDVRVLDLTRHLPGPWATMTLGDLGADVLKVERPGEGDPTRAASPRYDAGQAAESVYFCNVNRNKASIALDFTRDADRARFFALVAQADVVVENFRAGAADRMGIGYEALRERRPSLVYCAITGYGQHGTLAAMPGHDLNIAGYAGFLQFDAHETPRMPHALLGDYAAANAALAAILAGLVAARTSGVGAFIDVAMLDALSSWSAIHLTSAFAAGPGSAASAVEGWGGNPRYGLYRTRDGRYMSVSLLEKDLWRRFCEAFGREDLINPDETAADRLTAHGPRSDEYRAFITGLIASDDRDAWTKRFRELGLPVMPVNTPAEWTRSDVAAERGLFPSLETAALRRSIPQIGFPFRMRMADGSDALAMRRSPPTLGDADGFESAAAGERR
jgi:alpha-methylacyl-CoA racemase